MMISQQLFKQHVEAPKLPTYRRTGNPLPFLKEKENLSIFDGDPLTFSTVPGIFGGNPLTFSKVPSKFVCASHLNHLEWFLVSSRYSRTPSQRGGSSLTEHSTEVTCLFNIEASKSVTHSRPRIPWYSGCPFALVSGHSKSMGPQRSPVMDGWLPICPASLVETNAGCDGTIVYCLLGRRSFICPAGLIVGISSSALFSLNLP